MELAAVVVRITYIYLYKKFRNKTKETKPCKDVSACLCLFNRLIYMHGGYREFFKTWITIAYFVIQLHKSPECSLFVSCKLGALLLQLCAVRVLWLHG